MQWLPVRSNTGDDLMVIDILGGIANPDLVPEQSDTDIRHSHDHRVSGRPGAAVQPQGERILRQHSLSCARRPYAVRSRISLTRSIVARGCKNAKRPTVSPPTWLAESRRSVRHAMPAPTCRNRRASSQVGGTAPRRDQASDQLQMGLALINTAVPGRVGPRLRSPRDTRRARTPGEPLHAYREAIEAAVRLARETAVLIKARPHLELIREPDLGVVLFRRLGWKPSDYDTWSRRCMTSRSPSFRQPSGRVRRSGASRSCIRTRRWIWSRKSWTERRKAAGHSSGSAGEEFARPAVVQQHQDDH